MHLILIVSCKSTLFDCEQNCYIQLKTFLDHTVVLLEEWCPLVFV